MKRLVIWHWEQAEEEHYVQRELHLVAVIRIYCRAREVEEEKERVFDVFIAVMSWVPMWR